MAERDGTGTVGRVTTLESRTEKLEAQISRYATVAGYAAAVRSALGCNPATPMTSEDVEVIAYLVQPRGDVLVTWLVTTTGFALFETSRNGDRLTVAVPLWRVRRVVESALGGRLSVTVELDADRVITESGPVNDDGSHLAATTNTIYSVEAGAGPEEAAVGEFARLFRKLLIG